jgi:O-antigen polysaccharide polymerase Wzy
MLRAFALPEDGVHTAGRMWLVAVLALALCAGSLVFFSGWIDNVDYWPAIGVGAGIVSLAVIGLLRVVGYGWHSAPVVYIAFLWMFHFPMALFIHLIPDLWTQLSAQIYGWTQIASWYRAAFYSLLCVIAFAIGCLLVPPGRRAAEEPAGTSLLRFAAGAATAVAGVGWLYFLMLRAGGLDLFGSGYAALYNTVFGPDFATAVFLVSAGCFLAIVSAPARLVWAPVVLQLAGSVPVLLTGSRQFALIGPLVLAVLAVRRGIRVGFVTSAISCAMVLWLISYVGETRSHGVMEGVTSHAVGPVGALVEMGGSLETTSLALDWIENGDSYLLGGSYCLPFERGLGLVLPLRQSLETDPRAMNMVMVSRIGGLGGSAVAESYYNFSVFGTLYFLLLGVLLARIDAAGGSAASSILGVVLYAFLFQARNWFLSVPLFVILGLVPLAACLFLETLLKGRGGSEEVATGLGAVLPESPHA